jgi:hypothetical protein
MFKTLSFLQPEVLFAAIANEQGTARFTARAQRPSKPMMGDVSESEADVSGMV